MKPCRRPAALLLLAIAACLGACSDDDGDQTLPDVAITEPLDGLTVSGTVRITAAASDAGGVLRVSFAVDGDDLGDDDTPPYTWDWDSTPYQGEEVSLRAFAEDRAGNVAYSDYVVVRVVAP